MAHFFLKKRYNKHFEGYTIELFLIEGDEGSYLTNCQSILVIALHALHVFS